MLAHLDVAFIKEIDRIGVIVVVVEVMHFFDTCLNNDFGAVITREMGNIDFCTIGGYSHFSTLNDGIHFCMDGPNTVSIYHKTTVIDTVR